MTIRPIADDEADALARITLDVYTAEIGFLADDYQAELADVRGRAKEALVLVAVADGDTPRLLGGITYVGRPSPLATIDRADQAELRMLAVAPEARGQGVATALVQACIEQARSDGKREIVLHTADFMRTARRIYERAGFHRRPERDLTIDDGLVLLGYVLHLEG